MLSHLAREGWTDVALLERSVLTAGSSWHAAGGFHALTADPNFVQPQACTVDLFEEIQAKSGQDIGLHMTGGLTLAGTPNQWEWLQSVYREFQSIGIEDCRPVTREEAGAFCPIMSIDGIPGGMTPTLGHGGRLMGDLTVFNWDDDTFWITGSHYLCAWHMRWFDDHMEDGVQVRDIADATIGFAVAGPRSRQIVQALCDADISALPFMVCGTFDLGLIRAHVGRISVTGELGYEIHCDAANHVALRRALLEAGAGHGLREVGFNALLSLRLEKSFGVWSAEFTQGYTPRQTGMDRWIDWAKDFIGKDAAVRERDGPDPAQMLVTLQVDANGADASGYEPVWQDGAKVGFVTSGGYGHTIGKSLAMALVRPEAAAVGTALSVHIVGQERPATVIVPSPYDPSGKAMRA